MDFIKWIGFGLLAFLLTIHFGLHFYFKWEKKRKREQRKRNKETNI